MLSGRFSHMDWILAIGLCKDLVFLLAMYVEGETS